MVSDSQSLVFSVSQFCSLMHPSPIASFCSVWHQVQEWYFSLCPTQNCGVSELVSCPVVEQPFPWFLLSQIRRGRLGNSSLCGLCLPVRVLYWKASQSSSCPATEAIADARRSNMCQAELESMYVYE